MDSDQDIDIEIVDKDSGMSSLGGSKDETPERRVIIEDLQDDEEQQQVIAVRSADNEATETAENYEDEPDETLSERIWGLTEMFPEPVRKACGTVSELTVGTVKFSYKFTCSASWIFFTSAMILFAPVVFEVERAQMEEQQRSQQKQVLLGPGSAMGPGGLPAMPPMAR